MMKAFPTLRGPILSAGPPAKKAKKGGRAHVRPAKREVIVLKKYSSVLPKSKDRENLRAEGRIKELLFTRTLSPAEVIAVIRQGFSHIGPRGFHFLSPGMACCMLQRSKITM